MDEVASRVLPGKGKGTGVRRSTNRERTIVHGVVETQAATPADRVEQWSFTRKFKSRKDNVDALCWWCFQRKATMGEVSMHEVFRQIAWQTCVAVWQVSEYRIIHSTWHGMAVAEWLVYLQGLVCTVCTMQ